MKKVSLNQSLDPVSYQFIVDNYGSFEECENGVLVSEHKSELNKAHVKFFENGKASVFVNPISGKYSVLDFESHQDAVDFIRIK